MFERLRRAPAHRRHAAALYAGAVRQARQPVFYEGMGVPDTVDGRFEMIAIHVFLLLHRLKRGDETCRATAQALFDTMFVDMDRGLRELGAGDLGVGRRVKVMAKAFYGRIAAYEQGLAGGSGALAGAVRRNVFRGDQQAAAGAERLAAYMRDQASMLERRPIGDLAGGAVAFSAAGDSGAGDIR